MFSFYFDMLLPSKLGIKRHTQVFRCVRVRYDLLVYPDWQWMFPLVCEVDVLRLGLIEFDPPQLGPVIDLVYGCLQFDGGCPSVFSSG